MNTAISLPPTSCALVLHEDGGIELSFPTREEGDTVPARELFLGAVANLLHDDPEFVQEVISRGLDAPKVN